MNKDEQRGCDDDGGFAPIAFEHLNHKLFIQNLNLLGEFSPGLDKTLGDIQPTETELLVNDAGEFDLIVRGQPLIGMGNKTWAAQERPSYHDVHRIIDLPEGVEGVEIETINRMAKRLREEIGKREAEITDLRGNESDIKHTLQLARRLGEDLERGARREADVIVGEARLEAERVLMAAAEERRELQAEIVRLRSNRMRMMAEMRAVVDAYGRMIDDMEQQEVSAAR